VGDDLLRRGIESAGTHADDSRRREAAEAADRAYMEGRISEFVQAVDRCVELMAEQGNPGLERFKLRRLGNMLQINPVAQSYMWRAGTPAWRLPTPLPSSMVHRVLTPSGELASVTGIAWADAESFIRFELAAQRRSSSEAWLEVNKRRTVNFIGSPPANIGEGDAWRADVDFVIRARADELGGLLHRHGIEVP
jgi:hypothetical protein